MVFALAVGKPLMMVFLSDKDIANLKTGRTLFVDERHLKGKTFEAITIAHSAGDAEAVKLLDRYATTTAEIKLSPAMPYAHEGKCQGCNGIMAEEVLYKGKCAICWHDGYQRLLGNG